MGNCGNNEIDPKVEAATSIEELHTYLKEQTAKTKKELNQLTVFLSFKIQPKDIDISKLTKKEIQKKAAFLKKYNQTQNLCLNVLNKCLNKKNDDKNLEEFKSILNELSFAYFKNDEGALYYFPEKLKNISINYKNIDNWSSYKKKSAMLPNLSSITFSRNSKLEGSEVFGKKYDQISAMENSIKFSESIILEEEPNSPRSLTINSIKKVGNCQIENPLHSNNLKQINELEENEELSKQLESFREMEKINEEIKEKKESTIENLNIEEVKELEKKEEEDHKKDIKKEDREQINILQSPPIKKVMEKNNENKNNSKMKTITIADMVQLADLKNPNKISPLKRGHLITKKIISLNNKKIKKTINVIHENEKEIVDSVSESQKSNYTNSKNTSSINTSERKTKKRKKVPKKENRNNKNVNENKITNINKDEIEGNQNLTKKLNKNLNNISKQKNSKNIDPKTMTISTTTDDKDLNEEIKIKKLKEDLNFIGTDENGNTVIKQLNFKNIRHNDDE